MGVLFGDGVANFLVVAISGFLMTRFSFAAHVLEGLHMFKATAADAKDTGTAASTEGLSGKQVKKQARAAAKKAIFVEGAEQLIRVRIPKAYVMKAYYSEDFDSLVNGFILLFVNAVVVASPLLGYKLASYTWLLWMGCLVPLLTAYSLAKVEVFTAGVPRSDKIQVSVLCVILIVAAGCALEFSPPSFLDFRWEEANKELGWLITSLRRKFDVAVLGVPNITISPYFLKSLASIAAGTLSALQAPGAVRLARCLTLATAPPHATRNYVSFGLLPSVAMQLAFLLPALGPLLWVRPMVQEMLGWSESTVQYSRAAYLLLLAVIQGLATRPYVQAYLNSALVTWWTHKHSMTSWSKASNMGDWIRMRLDHINLIVCKVGVEILSPAVLWVACGSLLMFAAFKDGSQPEGWTHLAFPWNAFYKAPGEGAWVPHTLLTCTWGYVAWWTCTCWFLTVAAATSMLRNGMLN